MTTTLTDSFYLQRVKEVLSNSNNRYEAVGSYKFTRWIDRHYTDHIVKATLRDRTLAECEYKGYQIIVIGWHYDSQDVYDKNDQLTRLYDIEQFEISRLGEVKQSSSYYAYAWEIGSKGDNDPTIEWLNAHTAFGGVFVSDKESKTFNSAKKRIDVLASLKSNREILIANADTRIDYYKKENPYNVLVGDQPFVQAHGRLRKGLVIGTTGSRFIIGYVTPSNHNELKYKVVHQSQLWIEDK